MALRILIKISILITVFAFLAILLLISGENIENETSSTHEKIITKPEPQISEILNTTNPEIIPGGEELIVSEPKSTINNATTSEPKPTQITSQLEQELQPGGAAEAVYEIPAQQLPSVVSDPIPNVNGIGIVTIHKISDGSGSVISVNSYNEKSSMFPDYDQNSKDNIGTETEIKKSDGTIGTMTKIKSPDGTITTITRFKGNIPIPNIPLPTFPNLWDNTPFVPINPFGTPYPWGTRTRRTTMIESEYQPEF